MTIGPLACSRPITKMHQLMLSWLLFIANEHNCVSATYHYSDSVVCDRELDSYYWWVTSTEYFTCDADQECCGDAWNRSCCDTDTGLIIGLSLFFVLGAISFTCFCIIAYHYKKKTKYYNNFVEHYYYPISGKFGKKKKVKERRRSSASSIFSIFSVDSDIISSDPNYKNEKERAKKEKKAAKKAKKEAMLQEEALVPSGVGVMETGVTVGGWTHPNMVKPDMISLHQTSPVDVHMAAQPYMPGPAVYHTPNI